MEVYLLQHVWHMTGIGGDHNLNSRYNTGIYKNTYRNSNEGTISKMSGLCAIDTLTYKLTNIKINTVYTDRLKLSAFLQVDGHQCFCI